MLECDVSERRSCVSVCDEIVHDRAKTAPPAEVAVLLENVTPVSGKVVEAARYSPAPL